MNRQVVSADDGLGIPWPVPNANLTGAARQLRSSRPEIFYYLPSKLETPLGATETKPSAPDEDDYVFLGAVGGEPPKAAEEILVSPVELGLEEASQISLPVTPENLSSEQGTSDSIPSGSESEDIQNLGEYDVENQGAGNSEMAEERALLPEAYRGTSDENAAEFWRRLKNYSAFKGHTAGQQLKLAKAMLVEMACDWLENLEDGKKDTFQNLEAAFEEKYVKPSIVRYSSAREIFGRKQGSEESVEEYVNRLRNLNKRAAVGEETMKYAFLSGLRPPLASFVMGKDPKTFAEAIEGARVAEFSVTEGTRPDGQLVQEMAAMRQEIQRLSQKYDSVSLNAAIQRERKVTFEGGGQRSPSPGRVTDARGARERQPPQNYQRGRPNWRGQNLTRGGRFEQSRAERGGPTCGKCGRAKHTNVLYCPANGKQCRVCGRVGHFGAVCRLRKEF